MRDFQSFGRAVPTYLVNEISAHGIIFFKPSGLLHLQHLKMGPNNPNMEKKCPMDQ